MNIAQIISEKRSIFPEMGWSVMFGGALVNKPLSQLFFAFHNFVKKFHQKSRNLDKLCVII